MSWHPPREQHAWWIAGLGMLALMTTSGVTAYSYSVFVKPISAELGVGRLVISLGLPVLALMGSLYSPFVGRLVDRRPIGRVLMTGAVLLAAGLALVGAARSTWQIALSFGTFVAAGAVMAGSLPSTALVVNWFSRWRGRALGIVTAGASLGGIVFPPLAASLLPIVGWRVTLVLMGLAVLVLITPGAWLIAVNRPEQLGLGRDGTLHPEQPSGDAAGEDDEQRWSTRRILRQRSFWFIAGSTGLLFSGNTAMLVHIVPIATDAGIPSGEAALLISITAVCAFSGKLVYSVFGDRFDERAALWIASVVIGLSWGILMLGDSYAHLALAATANGLGTGGVLPAWNALVGRCFGRASFGSAMGLMRPFSFPLMNFGAPFAGFAFDRLGGYGLAFQVFAVMCLAAGLLSFGIRLPVRAAESVGSRSKRALESAG